MNKVLGAHKPVLLSVVLGLAAVLLAAMLPGTAKTANALEQAQLEAGLTFAAPDILDYMVNKRNMQRKGNRDRYMCPHGIYPCQGGRWIAIALADSRQWPAFCNVIGNPDWVHDPKFATLTARKENEDELDRLIDEWTGTLSAEHIMTAMQEAGIATGIVQTGEDLLKDPQLRHRHHFRVLDHPEIGKQSYHSPAYHLSETPCRIERPAPCLGEHNEHVYREILGFSEDEISDMLVDGIITTESGPLNPSG